MRYNKFVRDKISEVIRKRRAVPVVHIADDNEYWQKLKEKLQEEVDEFLGEANKEELADILEVIYAICDFKNFKREKLELFRKKKLKERGGFKKRIILDEVK